MAKKTLRLEGLPNPKQDLFLRAVAPRIAYGGARGGVLVVDADSNGVLNKTYKEIADAVVSIMRSKINDKSYDFYNLEGFGYDEYSGYYVKYDSATFLTDSENGYPSGGGGGPA